jgi:predicted Na+-dependent transporter
MSFTDGAVAGLAWLGRRGTQAVAVSAFIGIALPPLAALLKPLFAPTLFILLCLAFLRIDPGDMRRHVVKPSVVLAATGWIMLAVPALCAAVLALLRVAEQRPGLYVALIFQAAAPPIMSSPALIGLAGLDAALSLVTLIACTALTPLTATLLAALVIGPALGISSVALGIKLLVMLAGAALVAALMRRATGRAWIERQSERIDGLNVIALFVFVVALMEGVTANAIAHPALVLGLLALAFALSLGLAALTALMFAPAGWSRALTLGFAAGSRNMGLMLAAAAGAVPEATWLYFGLAQVPIYLMPQVLRLLAQRLATSRAP